MRHELVSLDLSTGVQFALLNPDRHFGPRRRNFSIGGSADGGNAHAGGGGFAFNGSANGGNAQGGDSDILILCRSPRFNP